MSTLMGRHTTVAVMVLAMATLLAVSAAAQDTSQVFQIIRTDPGLSLHKELFMLPVTLSNKYHGAETEAVFQISAKYRIFNLPVYFGYTQISFWQAYDRNNSAPFRETNYNPELFFRPKMIPFHGGQVGADIGFEHESNGQRPPISRSWNLLYACPYYYHGNFLVYLKLRYRFPEDPKVSPLAAVGDDNPDITDYLGHVKLHIYYRFPHRNIVHLMVQGNVRTGNGGAYLLYLAPIPGSSTSFFTIRISRGYGESLVDYKQKLTRVGFGVSFTR